jgi:hypothetical protein
LQLNGIDRDNALVEVFNATGKLVFSQEISSQFLGALSIDISNQPDGIYYLYINQGEVTFDEKIVIVR